MAYTLSANELLAIKDLSRLIEGESSSVVASNYWVAEADYVGKYYLSYQYLASVQLSSPGIIKQGADSSVYLWLNGASRVNRNEGFFSDFIRKYSESQVNLRIGPSDNIDIQKASNDIAKSVTEEVTQSNGQVPTLREIGNLDAGGVVGRLFEDPEDFAGWSGSVLFILLGDDSFFIDHIIDPKNGSYDLLAAIESVSKALVSSTSSPLEWFESLGETLLTAVRNDSGISLTTSMVSNAITKADKFYNDQFMSSVDGMRSLLVSNIVLGKLNKASDIDGTSYDDAIAGGNKADVIRGTLGRDVIDGGNGDDILDYSEIGGKILLTFGKNASGEVAFDVDKDGKARDSVTNIENIKLGASEDRVILNDAAISIKIHIDAGLEPQNKFDILDLRTLSEGINVSYINVNGINSLKIQNSEIILTNFEGVLGSSKADVISLGALKGPLYGRGGNDTLYAGQYGSIVDGGTGRDTIFLGQGVDKVILGGSGEAQTTNPTEGENQEENWGEETIEGGDATDRIYIRPFTGTEGADILIPLLGGVAMYAGWATNEQKNSTFANDENFGAHLYNTVIDYDGNQQSLGGNLSQKFHAGYSRVGSDLVVSAEYGENLYAVTLKNWKEGDFGISFVNGLNYLFTDGVESWRREGLATMSSKVSDALAPGKFSSAPLYTDPLPVIPSQDGHIPPPANLSPPKYKRGDVGDDSLDGTFLREAFEGGDGKDTVSYAAATEAVGIDLSDPNGGFGNGRGDRFLEIENFRLSEFSDNFIGDYSSQMVNAGRGDDIIWGRQGNDSLYGDAGNDQLNGEEGSDFLDGGAGDDTMAGGTGDDIYIVDTSNDTITEEINAGVDEVRTSISGFNLGINVENLTYIGTAAFTGTGNALANTLTGGTGNDKLTGGLGNDVYRGLGGNDFFYGGAGADSHDGGDGFDTVDYSAASAAIVIDVLAPNNSTGDAAGDTFAFVEQFGLSAYNDRFVGTGGIDYVYAQGGNDTLLGGGGDDWLAGGAGADSLDGQDGFDTADYTGASAAVVIDRATAANSTGDAKGDTFTSIERFHLSQFADRFVGSAESEYIYGNGGNDTLLGNDGNDWLIGGAGSDALTGGNGYDTASYFGAGAAVTIDRVTTSNSSGEAAGDTFATIEAFQLTANFADRFVGSSAAENVYGGGGNDTLIGNAGNDFLDGEEQNDVLTGGAGSDTFAFYERGFGKDIVTDFTSGDFIEFSTSAFASFAAVKAHMTQVGANAFITLDADDTVTLQNVTAANLKATDFHFV